MINSIREEGLYQNKVNSNICNCKMDYSLVSPLRYPPKIESIQKTQRLESGN